MKVVLILLLACLGSITPKTFEEQRDEILDKVFNFYKIQDIPKPMGDPIKLLPSKPEYKSYVTLKTINLIELGANNITSQMPEYIYDKIKLALFSEEPNVIHKIDDTIEIKDDKLTGETKGYKHLYGGVMHDDKTIFFIIFEVDVTYELPYETVFHLERRGKTVIAKSSQKFPDLSEENMQQLIEYINYQCRQKVINHIQQIDELNGKVLYSFNEGREEYGEACSGSGPKREAYIQYYSESKKVKLIFSNKYLCSLGRYYRSIFKGSVLVGDDNMTIYRPEDDQITGYITDDGYLNFMLRDNTLQLKRLIYKTKIFEPSGVLPYQFILPNADFLQVYDGNYKLLGVKIDDFYDYDLVWPDQKYFYSKSRNTAFYIENNYIYYVKFDSDTRTLTYSSKYCMTAKIKDDHNSGYLGVTKGGVLKHFSVSLNTTDWEPNEETGEKGPFSFDLFNSGLVLINGDGQVYWSTLDGPVESINKAYQAYMRSLN